MGTWAGTAGRETGARAQPLQAAPLAAGVGSAGMSTGIPARWLPGTGIPQQGAEPRAHLAGRSGPCTRGGSGTARSWRCTGSCGGRRRSRGRSRGRTCSLGTLRGQRRSGCGGLNWVLLSQMAAAFPTEPRAGLVVVVVRNTRQQLSASTTSQPAPSSGEPGQRPSPVGCSCCTTASAF